MSFLEQEKEIILASSSKIRKKILNDAGLDFKSIAPDFDEDEIKKNHNLTPQKLALTLAKGKALSISKKYPNSYIIGCDQVCEFAGKGVSKGKNLEEVKNQLTKFSGQIHYQNNGLVIAFNQKIIFENFEKVELKMRSLSADEISSYANFEKPLGCAGSYQYESFGKYLFEYVKGDYYAVLGLALQPLLHFLCDQKIVKIK